jgi:nucleoside-triphosphatase THEP1
MKKHIVIAGKRHVGKSTLINRLLEGYDGPVYGFRTASGKSMKKGCRSFFIHPASAAERFESEENHIGDGNGRERSDYPEAFNNFGVRCLEAEPDGVILMDELGFMEKDAEKLCSRVLELFDGDIPVIAAAKAGHDVDFLNKVLNHPNAEVYYINEDNRDDLFEEISAKIRSRGGLI